MFSISGMLEGLYAAKDGTREAFKEVQRLTKAAHTYGHQRGRGADSEVRIEEA